MKSKRKGWAKAASIILLVFFLLMRPGKTPMAQIPTGSQMKSDVEKLLESSSNETKRLDELISKVQDLESQWLVKAKELETKILRLKREREALDSERRKTIGESIAQIRKIQNTLSDLQNRSRKIAELDRLKKPVEEATNRIREMQTQLSETQSRFEELLKNTRQNQRKIELLQSETVENRSAREAEYREINERLADFDSKLFKFSQNTKQGKSWHYYLGFLQSNMIFEYEIPRIRDCVTFGNGIYQCDPITEFDSKRDEPSELLPMAGLSYKLDGWGLNFFVLSSKTQRLRLSGVAYSNTSTPLDATNIELKTMFNFEHGLSVEFDFMEFPNLARKEKNDFPMSPRTLLTVEYGLIHYKIRYEFIRLGTFFSCYQSACSTFEDSETKRGSASFIALNLKTNFVVGNSFSPFLSFSAKISNLDEKFSQEGFSVKIKSKSFFALSLGHGF